MRLKFKLLFIFATTPLCCVQANWPEFRGPTGQGVAPVESAPTTWDASKNVLWKTAIAGEGWSSPVVVRDRIYLTNAVEEETTGKSELVLSIVLIDAENGSVSLTRELFREPMSDASKIHKKNSHASSTPVLDGQNIYVHFGHQGTACVSLDGNIQWRNTELRYDPVHGNGGSPICYEDLLIFTRDGATVSETIALNKSNGKIAWQRPRDADAESNFSFCTPLLVDVMGKAQLIVPGSNVVQSLNPSTGAEIWRVNYEGYSVVPRPVVVSGLVCISTGYNTPVLMAIDPNGSGNVTDTHVRWTIDSNVPNTPSMITLDRFLIMVSDSGIASAIDAKTGKSEWRQRLGGNFSASPVKVNDHVYFCSEQGDCTILEFSLQKDKIEALQIARNEMGERLLASPGFIQNDLLIRTAGHLYRIHEGDQ